MMQPPNQGFGPLGRENGRKNHLAECRVTNSEHPQEIHSARSLAWWVPERPHSAPEAKPAEPSS
jgi:hypothetical protein